MDRPSGCMFNRSDLGAELDSATDDTTVLGRCFDGRVFEICSWVGLPSMRCEGAPVLCRGVVGKVVAEVVVLFRVDSDVVIVFRWCEVDGRSCASSSQSAQEAMLGQSTEGYIPLIQRPIKRAPRSSLPRLGSIPGMGFRFKNVWNSGTSWKR